MAKIMYILNYIGDGGTEKYVMNLIEAVGRDHCIFVYSTPGPLLKKFKQMNIPIYQVKMRHPFDLQAAWQVRKIALQENVDIIHAQFLRENFISILAKKLGANVRVIWTYHVDVPMPLFLRTVNGRFTKHNDTIICVSQFMKKRLLEKGANEEKLQVIYNGIENPLIMRSTNHDQVKQIGVIGRLSKEKGHFFLLQALKHLKRNHPSLTWHCNIIGEGPLMQNLVETAEAFGLSDEISFKGFRENVIEEYTNNDIIVVPSENESLSYVAIESLATQTPVIATNIGGLPEVVINKETGLLVPYGDEVKLAAAIQTIFENQELYSHIAKQGRSYYLQHFTIQAMIDKTFHVYEQTNSLL